MKVSIDEKRKPMGTTLFLWHEDDPAFQADLMRAISDAALRVCAAHQKKKTGSAAGAEVTWCVIGL